MKKIFNVILILALLSLIIYLSTEGKQVDKSKADYKTTEVVETESKIVETEITTDKHYSNTMMPVNCKTCHACDYPTKNDPCLANCPRSSIITVYHQPSEGPKLVHMNDVEGDYGEVTFSHEVHAQMSSFSIGCEGCHHYNTTGPVVKCKTCHNTTRKRKDIFTPDLEAAYHRQCLNCHRQWDRTTDCQQCHITKKDEQDKVKREKIKKFENYKHPPLTEPKKIVYQTKQPGGKYVTFYHNEHTERFSIACQTCHKDDNCISCHDVNHKQYSESVTKKKKTHKSFEQHHQPCINCHITTVCSKCHSDKPEEEFNHYKNTGFDLSGNHFNLKCNKCHKSSSFKGLNSNCTSCHNNFKDGKFDHTKTGIKLDEIHIDLSCTDCHQNSRFDKPPICSDCHDGYKYPSKVPGKIIR
ncbi:MAG: hypothetical protein A2X64_02740 [Ignavibacteria bacterium GWF2_33_9]|nr:MAG: hypothetical protein A2X64_02740 [Ignavibacteria bacterium GWF2_33_9]